MSYTKLKIRNAAESHTLHHFFNLDDKLFFNSFKNINILLSMNETVKDTGLLTWEDISNYKCVDLIKLMSDRVESFVEFINSIEPIVKNKIILEMEINKMKNFIVGDIINGNLAEFETLAKAKYYYNELVSEGNKITLEDSRNCIDQDCEGNDIYPHIVDASKVYYILNSDNQVIS